MGINPIHNKETLKLYGIVTSIDMVPDPGYAGWSQIKETP